MLSKRGPVQGVEIIALDRLWEELEAIAVQEDLSSDLTTIIIRRGVLIWRRYFRVLLDLGFRGG